MEVSAVVTGEPRHSGLGIAAFVTSVVAGLLMVLLFVVAGVLEATTPGGMDEESMAAVLVGLGLFGLLFADLVAIGLAIGALFQQRRKKLFAVLGLVFALATVVVAALLMVIGLMA